MPAFTLFGPRWDYGAAVANVTWAVDSTVPSFFIAEIMDAFASWSAYANINFQRVAPGAGAEITFGNASIDGASNTLGWASSSYTTGGGRQEYVRSTVRFDADEGWRVVGSDVETARSGIDLYLVALHEIGHSIGIDHSTAAAMVMNPSISADRLFGLTQHDIQAVQAIYGARVGAPSFDAGTGFSPSATPPVAPPTAPVAPTSPTGTTPSSTPLEDLTDPVFRFYDTRTQDHFYTASAAERDLILRTIPHYQYEGIAFETPDDGPGTVDVFRFFNTATQAHFFTTNEAERDQVMRTLPTFQYEGVAFQAYATAAGNPDALVLDRFYNTQSNMHHYSNGGETAWILAGNAGPGWRLEGPSFVMARVGSDGRLVMQEGVHEDGVYEAGSPASLNPFEHHDPFEGALLV
jgi:hypothetical protein